MRQETEYDQNTSYEILNELIKFYYLKIILKYFDIANKPILQFGTKWQVSPLTNYSRIYSKSFIYQNISTCAISFVLRSTFGTGQCYHGQ